MTSSVAERRAAFTLRLAIAHRADRAVVDFEAAARRRRSSSCADFERGVLAERAGEGPVRVTDYPAWTTARGRTPDAALGVAKVSLRLNENWAIRSSHGASS